MSIDPAAARAAGRPLCPFCGTAVDKDSSPIVATNYRATQTSAPVVAQAAAAANVGGRQQGADTSEFPEDLLDLLTFDESDTARPEHVAPPPPTGVGRTPSGNQPVSGVAAKGHIGPYPVLARPPWDGYVQTSSLDNPLGRLGGTTRAVRAPSLEAIGHPEDLPSRVCVECNTPVPEDLWTREVDVIAVVGMNMAAKTHYIAAALYQAYLRQGLMPYGFTNVYPDERTNQRLHGEHFRLFNESRLLAKTNAVAMSTARFEPLTIRLDMANRSRTLLFHDIAGEAYRDPQSRAEHARFLRYAAGIIFLIDPMGYPKFRQRVGVTEGTLPFSQDQIVAGIRSDLGARADEIPVAFAVTKADLIAEAFPAKSYYFGYPASADIATYHEQLRFLHTEAESVVYYDLDDPGLWGLMKQFARSSFHCVAPIGRRANHDGTISEVTPMRCLDPLYMVLANS